MLDEGRVCLTGRARVLPRIATCARTVRAWQRHEPVRAPVRRGRMHKTFILQGGGSPLGSSCAPCRIPLVLARVRTEAGAMDDLIVRGGLVAGARRDVAIRDGRIRRIDADIHAPARAAIEAKGQLVLPGFVESHIHPDKAFVADRTVGLSSGGPTPQALVAALKRAFTEEVIF